VNGQAERKLKFQIQQKTKLKFEQSKQQLNGKRFQEINFEFKKKVVEKRTLENNRKETEVKFNLEENKLINLKRNNKRNTKEVEILQS
jgi:hypothetical protein